MLDKWKLCFEDRNSLGLRNWSCHHEYEFGFSYANMIKKRHSSAGFNFVSSQDTACMCRKILIATMVAHY